MVAPWKPSEFHAPDGVSGKQFSRIPPGVLSWRDTAFSFGGITVSVLVLTMTGSLSGISDTEGTDIGETAINEQSITSVTLWRGIRFVFCLCPEEELLCAAALYEYPSEVRKIIYTTNILQRLNRQYRQIIKNEPGFASDVSHRGIFYLASRHNVKHWHARCQNWELELSQLEILFAGRADG